MEKGGCGILFFKRSTGAVLVSRRDDKPSIPFPDCLDILGGTLEAGETPEAAIVREIKEELTDLRTGEPFKLGDFQHWKSYRAMRKRGETTQTIFWAEADFELGELRFHEGRELLWITLAEINQRKWYHEFGKTVREFLLWCQNQK